MKLEIFLTLLFFVSVSWSNEVLEQNDDDETFADKRAPIFWPSKSARLRRPQREQFHEDPAGSEEDENLLTMEDKRAIPVLRFGKRTPLLRFGRGVSDSDEIKRASSTLLRFGKRPDVVLRFGREP